MPGGIDYSHVGSYVALAAVKAGVYTAYAGVLNRWLDGKSAAPVVGAARTAIGMTMGGAYFWAILQFTGEAPPDSLGLLPYWASLLPLRIAEWWLLLRIFYSARGQMTRSVPAIAWGIGASYLADLPAALGWVLTGGLWIC